MWRELLHHAWPFLPFLGWFTGKSSGSSSSGGGAPRGSGYSGAGPQRSESGSASIRQGAAQTTSSGAPVSADYHTSERAAATQAYAKQGPTPQQRAKAAAISALIDRLLGGKGNGGASKLGTIPTKITVGVNSQVPARLLPFIHEASAKYKIPESLLASILRIETDFGRNPDTYHPNSAGAMGIAQFIPSTAAEQGLKDRSDDHASILAMAKYLTASGYHDDPAKAIFAYNHADWYVNDVLKGQKELQGKSTYTGAPGSGAAQLAIPAGISVVHPIAGKHTVSSYDNGIDFETKPGTGLRAIGAGRIVNAHGSFLGPGSLVLKLDKKPAGAPTPYVYYGHVDEGDKKVMSGRVRAGQVIARSSVAPPGATDMPGHVEIGFADGPGGGLRTGGAFGPSGRDVGSDWAQAFKRVLEGKGTYSRLPSDVSSGGGSSSSYSGGSSSGGGTSSGGGSSGVAAPSTSPTTDPTAPPPAMEYTDILKVLHGNTRGGKPMGMGHVHISPEARLASVATSRIAP